METLEKMMKQVKFVSCPLGCIEVCRHPEQLPSIKIAECKHQINFLKILFLLFKHLERCELLVTSLKA